MTDRKTSDDVKNVAGGRKQDGQNSGEQPDWTNGLRQLYDSVVEEPLPDQFKDLLSQLDKNG